jgi:catechol 2,3-dioxygenase-like lactoylglutathione lyase family enzyme
VKVDHIGLVTNDIERFEDFWVKGMGFNKIREVTLRPEKVRALFGMDKKAKAYIYQKEGVRIEVHVFNPPLEIENMDFDRFGVNHVSLYVDSKEQFIQLLRFKIGNIDVRKFQDPGGWYNIFVRDFDGNWIEIREEL